MRTKMFKAVLLISVGMVSQLSLAQALEAPIDYVDELEEARADYDYRTRKFDELMSEIRTQDIFAGRSTTVEFRGKSYAVDRTMEAVKAVPSRGGRQPTIGSILGELGVKSSGKIRVTVTHREFGKDGKLVSEDVWEIDMGGAWEAQSGMDDAMGKQHK